MMPAYQLPLQIKLNDAATFASFYAAGNEDLVALLKQGTEPYIYIWSAEAAGKTHLLQSVCRANENPSSYLPLADCEQFSPEILDELEQFNMICLDDVNAIAGRSEWEEALFHLYNRVKDTGSHLRVTANATAGNLSMKLQDLVSRLNWGPVFHLHSLTDEQKTGALKMRASLRGFDLSDEVANYLLNHYPRDMHNLFAILDRLDEATLQAQRRLTIPFIKKYI